MKTLNLGCGASVDRRPGVVNVDSHPYPGVEVWDVDDQPWPWADETFDMVQAIQLFEHVREPVGFMREAWRVLRPGGTLFLRVPHYLSENSHTDPTHVRHCTLRTFDYWIAGTHLNQQFGPAYAGEATFSSGRVEQVGGAGEDIEARLVK